MADLTVLGQDPRYGGGARAQMDAFLDGARALGRRPELVFVPHPSFDGRRVTADRIEALRVLRGRPALSAPLWVVATTAHHGAAAPRSGIPYDCWVACVLEPTKWRGRLPGLLPFAPVGARLERAGARALERRVLRGARRVFATSAWSRDTIAEATEIDAAAIRILPLPVDFDAFAPRADEQWLARLAQPVLAFVGRADDPRKNVDLSLDAAQLVPGARVRLIGAPPRGRVPEGVEVVGSVESVAPHLRTASLLVLPSRQEGFGIVAAEALAAGVPVVATPQRRPRGAASERSAAAASSRAGAPRSSRQRAGSC